MTEEKRKRLIVSATVGAVLLIVILIFVMVFQLVSIGNKKREIKALNDKIAEYKVLIEDETKVKEARSSYWWIVSRARELGYCFDGDEIYTD